ncbi:MAG TPA: HemK2/MTQ2 family protein methyltransferase [Chitinophagaceae bacterium]|jgi:release factor glutamine methyltransferase
MKNAIKYIVGSTWQPFLVKYLSKTRTYHYKDIHLQIPASVFHPGFFFSTHLLLKQLKDVSLKNKKFLEPGAGSGLISIFAAKQGAIVTATDINPVAVECTYENSLQNNVHLDVLESDLFDEIPKQCFDFIVINPPYYKKEQSSYADYAWNCGENGEYFQKLFSQLKDYTHEATKIYMVLCDGCDIEMVKSMAAKNSFELHIVFTKQNVLEKNFIYSIETIQ